MATLAEAGWARAGARRWLIAAGIVAVLAVAALVAAQDPGVAAWLQRNGVVLRQSLLSGLLIGGVYGLVAMGLTLIFGVLGIINFAHGALMGMAMYLTYFAFRFFGIDPYLSLLISVPALFLVGAFLQRTVVSRVMTAPEHSQLLLTLGLALVLENLYLVLFTADPLAVQTAYGRSTVRLLDTAVTWTRIYAFAGGLVLGGLLWLLLTRTDTGKAIRAAAQEREGAALMGINVPRINMITFGLGTAAAGAAGSLIMPFFTVTPTTGETFNITSFVVVVLGGMGNVPGAMLGGILIGLTEAVGAVFLPGSSKQLLVFLVFILVLLFRPQGLFGGRRHA